MGAGVLRFIGEFRGGLVDAFLRRVSRFRSALLYVVTGILGALLHVMAGVFHVLSDLSRKEGGADQDYERQHY